MSTLIESAFDLGHSDRRVIQLIVDHLELSLDDDSARRAPIDLSLLVGKRGQA
jgi:hypothetical protein